LSSHHVSATTDYNRNLRYGNPALTPKQSFPLLAGTISTAPVDSALPLESFDIQKASSLVSTPLPLPSHSIVLYATTMILAHLENKPTGFINHTSWVPSTSSRDVALVELPRKQWPETILVPSITEGGWIDLIINNLDDGGKLHFELI
jgi:hypothetical protein